MDNDRKPLNTLNRQLDSEVKVTLKNGVEYKGKMVHCDNYMNLILNGASEYFNGQLNANYGKALVRGNNILYIAFDSMLKTRKNNSE